MRLDNATRLAIGCLLAGCVLAGCSGDGNEPALAAVNLESVFAEMAEQAPPLLVQQQVAMGTSRLEPGGTLRRIPLDPESIRLVAEPLPGVQTFAVRYEDGTGLCLVDVELGQGGAGTGCTDAADFNARGLNLATEHERGSYTVLLFPDGTEIVDLGTGLLQPSGSAVVLKGLALEAQVRAGKLDL